MGKDQDSVISKFYEKRSVFITGATGFIGKVLLEKLLRSCPDIKNIYILMRDKRGKTPEQRWEQLMNCKVFDLIKKDHREFLDKVIVVKGDILLPFLGISESDITVMNQNVSIVFHSAASIKFEEPLKTAIDFNVLGTRRVMELCHKLQGIEALIHVSTAFSNCNLSEIEEVIYPPPMPIQQVVEITRWLDPEALESITRKITDSRPNTYIFTKALAESMLAEECGSLSVTIIRPSIVSASWREPFPGWVDNYNGPTGIIVAIGKGLLRTAIYNKEVTMDIIPVDVLVNLMIASAWHSIVHGPQNTMVYNCTSGSVNKLTFSNARGSILQYLIKYPPSGALRYPHITSRQTQLSQNIHAAYQHYLMAYFVDTMSYIFCRKPWMVEIYEKIHKATDILTFFVMHEWKFHCDNILMLNNLLTVEDKQKFFLDIKSLNWDSYWENTVLGTRRFVLREDPSTIPAARKNLRMRYVLSQVAQVVLVIGVSTLLFSKVLSLNNFLDLLGQYC